MPPILYFAASGDRLEQFDWSFVHRFRAYFHNDRQELPTSPIWMPILYRLSTGLWVREDFRELPREVGLPGAAQWFKEAGTYFVLAPGENQWKLEPKVGLPDILRRDREAANPAALAVLPATGESTPAAGARATAAAGIEAPPPRRREDPSWPQSLDSRAMGVAHEMMDVQGWINVAEVARRLGVTRTKLYRRCPAFKALLAVDRQVKMDRKAKYWSGPRDRRARRSECADED